MKRFFERYVSFWKNTFNFHDSISRSEYWLTALSIVIITLVATFVITLTSLLIGAGIISLVILIVFGGIFTFASIIPYLSLGCRRAIDVGIKIQWYILPLIANTIISGINIGSKNGVLNLISVIIVIWTYYILLSPADKHVYTKYIGINAQK